MSSKGLNYLVKKSGTTLLPRFWAARHGLQLRTDWLEEKHLHSACQVLKKAVLAGDSGVETANEDKLTEMLVTSSAAAGVFIGKSDDVIGVVNVLPQFMNRSAAPITNRGYLVLDPQHRRLGISNEMMHIQGASALLVGYLGITAHTPRFPSPSSSVIPKISATVCCVIPRGVWLEPHGWSSDVIFHGDYRKTFPRLPNAQMTEEELIERALDQSVYIQPSSVQCTTGTEARIRPPEQDSAIIRPVKDAEGHVIYKILTEAAEKADGFGVDEFPSQDIFTNRFLIARSAHVLIHEGSKKILGVIIIGPSHLTRGNPDIAVLNIYILPEYRCRGYGTLIEKVMSERLQALGYSAILSDILQTNVNSHSLARKGGYVNIGSIPMSTYVKNHGWTDVIVYCKEFSDQLSKSWVTQYAQTLSKQ